MQPSRPPEGVLADSAVSLRVPPGVVTATLPATPPGKTAAWAASGHPVGCAHARNVAITHLGERPSQSPLVP